MPIRKRLPYKRKRTYRRRRIMRKPQVSRMNRSPVSTSTYVKMKYAGSLVLNDAVGGIVQSHIFSGNNLNDPDVTGVGHQPLGHDQWANFYSKYNVLGSKIQVKLIGVANVALVSLYASLSSSSTADVDTSCEQPYSRRMLIGVNDNAHTIGSYRKTHMIWGAAPTEKFDDTYSANMNSSPTRHWYWHIESVHPDKTSTHKVVGYVNITYYVRLFDRVQLSQS
mgnify:CR=1 FL=1